MGIDKDATPRTLKIINIPPAGRDHWHIWQLVGARGRCATRSDRRWHTPQAAHECARRHCKGRHYFVRKCFTPAACHEPADGLYHDTDRGRSSRPA